MENIKKAVHEITKFACCIYKFTNRTSPKHFESFLSNNNHVECVFVNNHVHVESFLVKFSHIIFFEISQESESFFKRLKQLCFDSNYEYAEFELYNFALSKEVLNKQALNPSLPLKNIILSQNLVNGNPQLIKSLDAKYRLFYRCYNWHHSIDILLDEFTGIQIFDFNTDFKRNLSQILKKLSHDKLKLRFLYVIIINPSKFFESENETDLTRCMSMLARFCAKSLAESRYIGCKLKLVYTEDAECIPSIIDKLSKISNQYRRSNFMLTYYKLSEQAGSNEVFLLEAGLNSFISQYILSNFDLLQVLSMSLDEFISRFGLIHIEMARSFFRYLDFKPEDFKEF